MNFLSTRSHSIVTACVVAAMSLIGYGIYAVVGMAMFYIGREHSQAEYRYMKLKGITRSKLGFFDGFKIEAWDKDSLLNDLIIPILVGLLIIWIQILFSAGKLN